MYGQRYGSILVTADNSDFPRAHLFGLPDACIMSETHEKLRELVKRICQVRHQALARFVADSHYCDAAMQHAEGMSHGASDAAAFPTLVLTNSTMLPKARDPDCGIVLLNGGGTWIGHVGPGLVFLLWGLWWTANVFLTSFRQNAAGKPYSCRAYYSSPWYHARIVRYLRHWEAITMIWGPLFMVWLELKGDHTAYT